MIKKILKFEINKKKILNNQSIRYLEGLIIKLPALKEISAFKYIYIDFLSYI